MASPVSGVVGTNMNGNWVSGGLHQLGGAGLPSTGVSHGASQSVGGLMNGPGMPGGGVDMTYGSNTGVDPIGNPRMSIHTQYMVDTDLTNVDYDMGDQELVFMNTQSGDESLIGQNKPHEFKSLHAMNRMFQLPENRKKWSNETDTVWFNHNFSFAGVVRHLDAKGRLHLQMGDLCQLVVTGGKVMIYDVFTSCYNRQSPQGPQIGDLLQLLLVKVKIDSEIQRVLPNPSQRSDLRYDHVWKLIPYYDKNNSQVSPHLLYNRDTKTMGQSILVGKVSAIYGGADNSAAARALCRKYINNPTIDNSYQKDLYKLRRIEIEVGLT